MEEMERAEKAAVTMLAGRMLTCREVFDRLRRKGYSVSVSETVVEKFLEAGYLDDARYAELYICDAVNPGAKGLYRIRQELLQKGISASVIQEAIDNTEADVMAALKQYVEEHHLFEGVMERRELEKRKARLVRRGYSLREIQQCLEDCSFSVEEEMFRE